MQPVERNRHEEHGDGGDAAWGNGEMRDVCRTAGAWSGKGRDGWIRDMGM